MNKKLLAVAVAGALALPGVALAQSSVTISGTMKMSLENIKLSNTAKTPSSQTRLADDSSRLIFSVVEDLGGGLSAIGQYDIRIKMDDNGSAPAAVSAANNVGGNISSGNTHIGLRSPAWGRVIWGKQDIHYVNSESSLALHGDLRADSTSLISHINGVSIANASRTLNLIRYTTPNWGGFTVDVGYSTNPSAADADIGSGNRRGRAWNVNPNLQGRNYQIGYSYWSSKPDGAAAAALEQRGDRLYGSYAWGGLKAGLAWDKTKFKVAGVETANRTAWSIPVSYTWGPNQIHGHYTKARDNRSTAIQDGAKMFAISYAYLLSKRTSMALTYAKITNDIGSTYQLFTTAGLGDAASAVTVGGEDPRVMALTVRHAF